MANKSAADKLAYEAGRAMTTEPSDRRSVDACPFAEGTSERTQWLEGFAAALDEAPDVSELKRQLKEAK